MRHPDEGTIHAWLDGALSDAEAAEIATHVQECETCAAATAEARGLIAAASRILGQLDNVPAGVRPAGAVRLHRPWYRRVPVQAAAGVLVAALGMTLVIRDRGAERFIMRAPSANTTVPIVAAPETPAAALRKSVAETVAAPTRATREGVTVAQTSPAHKAAKAMSLEQRATRQDSTNERASEALDVAAPANRDVGNLGFSPQGAVGGAVERAPAPAAAQVQPREATVGGARAALCKSAEVIVYTVSSGEQVILVNGDSLVVMSEQCVAAGTPIVRSWPSTSRMQKGGVSRMGDTRMRAMAKESSAGPSLRVLQWADTKTKRVYVLRGRVSAQELDSLRKTIEQ